MDDQGLLYLQIGEALARSIRSGVLRRGERVPSVRQMAAQRGVSMATVTQAYRWLEDARLIEARPRSGYFVCNRPRSLPEPETTQPPAASQSFDRGDLVAQVIGLAEDPAYFSFGAACPDGSLFDQDRLRRAVARAATRHRGLLAQYARGPGREELRHAVARHAIRMGCELDPRRVLITNGCLDGIVMCLRAVTQPGDVVALESPTYFGLLEILEHLGLRALEIPTHPRDGLALDALQFAFETQPVKAVLVVPTLSNPLGSCMPTAERRRLARMAAEHDVPVIEDVIYNDLCEHEERRRAVKSFDTAGHVMICGSFTKTLAPGIRLGWVEGGRWHDGLVRRRVATGATQTSVLELALADLLAQPGNESNYRQLRAAIGSRCDDARALIARSFPRGTRVTDPPGGYILWIELPDALEADALFRACLAERIVIAPGSLFSATERYRHCLRLGVGGRWDEAHRTALRRVGRIASDMLRARTAGSSEAEPLVAAAEGGGIRFTRDALAHRLQR